MNNRHKLRLVWLIVSLIGLAVGTGLVLIALNQNLNAFLTPTELRKATLSPNQTIRLGGLVKPGSLHRDESGLDLTFLVTDFHTDVPVRYHGTLPDLFHEGKGMIATGHQTNAGLFIAQEVLAKHDENYTPSTVKRSMSESS